MDERLLWIIVAVVALVGIICMVTILIVTGRKSRRGGDYEEDAYDEVMRPVTAVKKQPKPQTAETPKTEEKEPDLRELIYRGQRPSRPDFGFSEENPVITASPKHSEKYLSLLRTEDGEPFCWIRENTVSVRNLNRAGTANVEVFLLYLHGKEYERLYICPYGRNSSGVPRGMKLSADGRASVYGGSLAAEAEAKGISVEQVLRKQERIYESARQQETGSVSDAPSERPADEEEPSRETIREVREEKPAESRTEPGPDAGSPSASAFPNYLPGFEPDNIRPSLEKFLAVMDRAYPDGVVKGSTWDHERWDRAAAMLCKYLGYKNGTEFLEAYGYTVVK